LVERLKETLSIKEEINLLYQCALNIQEQKAGMSNFNMESNLFDNAIEMTFKQIFNPQIIFDISVMGIENFKQAKQDYRNKIVPIEQKMSASLKEIL
jgi:hypothetical protein